jgi:chromosome segregation ATPase
MHIAKNSAGDQVETEQLTEGEDLRGRARRRIGRLEERLGETRSQLDRARGRRDELEQLLERMVETETSRRDDLAVRERGLERRRADTQARHEELEQRAVAAEQRNREAHEELEAVRSELTRLRAEFDEAAGARAEFNEASGRMSDELRELRGQAQQVQQLRGRLESDLAEARERAAERERELLEETRLAQAQAEEERDARARVEAKLDQQRERAEQGAKHEHELTELRSQIGRLRSEADDERRRGDELEAAAERLRAELEEAQARHAEESEWHNELETRLAQTEETADSVLKDIDEEIENSLGRAALERERRMTAEARLLDAGKTIERLEQQLGGAGEAPQASEPAADDEGLAGELETARREIETLRAELDAAAHDDTAPEQPTDTEPADPLHDELEALRAELEQVRAEADSHEQARRRIIQLEDELSQAHSEQNTSLLEAAGGSREAPEPDSRAPLRDASELPGLSDEELAETFSSMREAARLADDRDDRDGAQEHRALARAAAEEAANRPDFGEAKVRGRKKNRLVKELAAAREKALSRRPILAVPVGEEEPEAE